MDANGSVPAFDALFGVFMPIGEFSIRFEIDGFVCWLRFEHDRGGGEAEVKG